MADTINRIDELKSEIIQIVIDFALSHSHIKSPLVTRGLELNELLQNEQEQKQNVSNL